MSEATPATRILPPFWFLAALLLEVVLDYYLPVQQIVTSMGEWLGWVFVAAGLLLTIWSANLFRKADTAIKPFTESSHLVSVGPYRYTRNPMYMGMVFVLTGCAVILGSLTPFFVVPLFIVFITRRFIVHEEAMLQKRFGTEYAEFCQRVSRWI